MGIQNVIAGPLSPNVHAVLDAPAVRSKALWHGHSFSESLDDALLVSVDREHGALTLVPETPITARALSPGATGWYARAGEVMRGVIDYAEHTGRPIEGLGMGTTPQQFVAARSTSRMQEFDRAGQLDAERAVQAIRSTGYERSLYGTHERGRIFLTPLVTNVLLNPHQPSTQRALAPR